jgi:hypothetical protein
VEGEVEQGWSQMRQPPARWTILDIALLMRQGRRGIDLEVEL